LILAANLPHPDVDYDVFEAALEAELGKIPQTYCPISKKTKPWVDTAKLRRSLGKGGGCAVM